MCYGEDADDEPEDAIHELNGQNPDVNHQFGGKYVWLVPEYTTDPNAAATSFNVSIQRIADLSMDDVAKGAHGGKYRYIEAAHNSRTSHKIKEVLLLRSEGTVASVPAGWAGMSKDINEDRGRTCLHLVWK